MKRTRKWAFVAQEAKRLAALGLANAEIGERLGVDVRSIRRWRAEGKLSPKVSAFPPVMAQPGRSPKEWADAVRADYDLDATDEQLVTVGEAALALSLDSSVKPQIRMAAAGRFQQVVRQLNLVARAAEAAAKADAQQQASAAQPKKNPIVRRSPGDDPRALLTAVK